jgi:hypothetical protein
MDNRDIFKQAKLDAIRKYAEQAEQELGTETGRNRRANAQRRSEWARRHLALFQSDEAFWGNCGMESAYQMFVRCGCNVKTVSAV